MSRPKEVKITHGDQEGYVLEASVPVWERHGWTRADDGSSEEAQNDAAPTQADEGQEV